MAEFHNPNLQAQGSGGSSGGGGGDTRIMMAVMLLVFIAIFGYDYLRPKSPATTSTAQTQTAQPTAAEPLSSAASPQPSASASGASMAQLAPSQVAQVTAAIETETTIENDQYRIVFTNRGAIVKHWILKHYDDSAGKPLDMVQPKASALFGFPLSLFTYEPALTAQINQALYQVKASGAQPSATGQASVPQTNALTFHYAAGGLDVLKTIRFDQSYVVAIETQVTRNGMPVRALVEWPAGLGDQTDALQFVNGKFAWYLDGKDDSTDAKKVSNNATFEQPYDYAAINDLYFAAAFLPDAPARTTVVTLHNPLNLTSGAGDQEKQKPADTIGLAVGDTSGSTRLRLYAGPKQLDLLKTIHATAADGKPTGPSLEPIIQYGFWGFIAKPLYLALRFLHLHLGASGDNWGWAIIIFTTVFTVIMMPFRFMALKSSLKMMRVQPKVEAIKNRYKHLKATDPKRADMNSEMMELYKVEGVNMYGSCLPMLPQIPLFFAYFRVLQNAVELRQAHWFWLTDLSAPDPKYILPIVIIFSMFLVQILTPSPGMDPAQRRMMAFMMPVMFGFFLLHYASGLALYWGTSNLINLALQIGINQSHIGKEMRAIAEKRAAKKIGGGTKTIQGRR